MVVNLVARAATPADVERMIAPLDQQFIFGKGRRISLAQRFPAVYSRDNAGNLFLIEENGEVLTCLACKRFSWFCDGVSWNGAMIGAVYTSPQRRGEKLASRLLELTAQTLRERGLDFAVLWTGQPAFYARLGWTAADRGVLGEFEGDAGNAESGSEIMKMPAQEGDTFRIERMRQRWCRCLTPRRSGDYRQLPPPAEAVQLCAWDAAPERAAYALVGNAGDTGILYEMIGHPDGFAVLWPAACRRFRRIVVNDVNGSPSHRWLVQNTGLAWQEKPLAMWLPLSAKTNMALVAHWYIPYFDRI